MKIYTRLIKVFYFFLNQNFRFENLFIYPTLVEICIGLGLHHRIFLFSLKILIRRRFLKNKSLCQIEPRSEPSVRYPQSCVSFSVSFKLEAWTWFFKRFGKLIMFCMNFSHSLTWSFIVHDVILTVSERLNFIFVWRGSGLETDHEMDKNGQEGSCDGNAGTNTGKRSFVFTLQK
jgi:hypothetical protein